MSPKINTETTRQQREWRREQLLSVALQLALESSPQEISMTELARRAGLSRTSVYEYFSSTSDLITQVLIQELEEYRRLLNEAVLREMEPEAKVRAWIEASLAYITSGDHLLARGMGAISSNPESIALFRRKHQALLAPLEEVFFSLGVTDTKRALTLTQAIVDIAAKNIERSRTSRGADQDAPMSQSDTESFARSEVSIAVNLVLATLSTLKSD